MDSELASSLFIRSDWVLIVQDRAGYVRLYDESWAMKNYQLYGIGIAPFLAT